jgi:hypothetical protein
LSSLKPGLANCVLTLCCAPARAKVAVLHRLREYRTTAALPASALSIIVGLGSHTTRTTITQL